MIARLRARLIRWCVWLIRALGQDVVLIPPTVRALLPVVTEIAQEAERMTFVASAFKHSHVFATCVKRCPEAARQDIGLAIELVVRDGGI